MERLRAVWHSSTVALTERNFRLFWIGQTGSFLGDALVGVALAFAVLELTGSAADLGLVFAAFALPRVLFTLAGGVWSDRLPRQRVMVACDLARAAAQAVMSTRSITACRRSRTPSRPAGRSGWSPTNRIPRRGFARSMRSGFTRS